MTQSPPLPELREITHISHSSKELWQRCMKSWFLKYMAKAPRTPALWSAGGSAVHEATEEYDRAAVKAEMVHMDVPKAWKRHFEKQLAAARAAEPNENAWKRSQTEGIAEWNQLGPQFVQAYIDWRQRTKYEVWVTPDGEPAIELDISGYLPGCEVEIKAYVDRITYEPVMKRYDVIDLKTGKSAPGPDQFVVYAALIKEKYGLDTGLGVPFMNRKGGPGKPHDLTGVEPAEVGAVFQEAWEAIQKARKSGSFEPDKTSRACFLCDVSASCYWKNGPLAERYDPLHPKHPLYTGLEVPPF